MQKTENRIMMYIKKTNKTSDKNEDGKGTRIKENEMNLIYGMKG